MNTWSLEAAFLRAYSAVAVRVQGLLDFGAGLEQLTRPPRMGHDAEVPPGERLDLTLMDCLMCERKDCIDPYCRGGSPRLDGADQLAEREAEEEVSEPAPYSIDAFFRENRRNWAARIPTEVKSWTCIGCGEKWYDEDHDHDCPSLTPSEPGLTDDELVGVRGLLQERYEPVNRGPRFCRDRKEKSPSNVATFCDERAGHDGMHRHGRFEFWPNEAASAPVNQLPGIAAEPDSPVAGARAAGSSPSEVSGAIPPASPSEGCTGPSRSHRLASVRGEAGAPDSGIPPSPGAPDLAAWLEPAVLTILSDHIPHPSPICAEVACSDVPSGKAHHYFRDWQAWQEHASKLIAAHIAKALEAEWLPQHTKPQQ